jgi:predicted ATPase
MPSFVKYGALSESRFVGRVDEFASIIEHLYEAVGGQGRLVFIAGEAGIGKSRIMSELVKHTRSQNILTLSGRCLYQENKEPYLPFIDAFGEFISGRKQNMDLESIGEEQASEDLFSMGLVGIAGGSASAPEGLMGQTGEGIEDIVPMGLLPIDDEMETPITKIKKIDLQQERTMLFESLSQLVIDISEKQPLLLVLDDLQWADDGSLQLLHYLARNIQTANVMICGAYRPEDIEDIRGSVHILSKTLKRMRPENLFYEIKLERFDENSTGAMVKSMMKRQEIPKQLVRRLYEESEGNPYFIEEVVKSLINEGIIDLSDYDWDKKFDPSRINIPSTIKDVIGRRIDRLDDETNTLLRYASVIGNKFTFQTLHHISNIGEDDLIDSIDALISANIINEDESSVEEMYRFDHTQIREVIYNSMSKSRRRLMHKNIGYIIEELNKTNLEDVIYNLAHHFYLGKDTEKTIFYSIKAGDKATASFAPEEALSYYNMALEAMERLEKIRENKTKMITILKRLGEISFNLSEWKLAMDYFTRSITLSEETENDLQRSESHRKRGYVLNRMANWQQAAKNFEQSLAISNKLEDKVGNADSHRGLGYIHWRLGEYEDAIEHYNQSIQSSMEIGDMHTISIAFIEMGNVYIEKGDLDKAIEYYNKSLKELEPIGDFGEMARAYHNLGDSYLKKGSYEKAIDYFLRCEEMGKKIGRRDIVGWSLFNRGEAYALNGDPDKALECAEKALIILTTIGDKLGILACYKIFGMAYGFREEWDKAIENFKICSNMIGELNIPYVKGEVHYHFGRMYKDKGDSDLAMEQFGTALEIFQNLETEDFLSRVKKEIKEL